jgi:phage gpG-like protein
VIDITITGREQIVAKLGQVDTGIRAALRLAIQTTVVDLQAKVQEKLSGPVLNARSGRLRNSIATQVDVDPAQITGTVSAKTPYAAIQEYGGTTRAHLIEARDAQSLAFMIGGKMVFAKSVQHPGSNIPERSYLRSTLAENALSIADRLRQAVQQAIYDQGLAE